MHANRRRFLSFLAFAGFAPQAFAKPPCPTEYIPHYTQGKIGISVQAFARTGGPGIFLFFEVPFELAEMHNVPIVSGEGSITDHLFRFAFFVGKDPQGNRLSGGSLTLTDLLNQKRQPGKDIYDTLHFPSANPTKVQITSSGATVTLVPAKEDNSYELVLPKNDASGVLNSIYEGNPFTLNIETDMKSIPYNNYPWVPLDQAGDAVGSIVLNTRFEDAPALIAKGFELAEPLVADAWAFKCAPTSHCFLTTAAVGAIALADDCWELRTLRNFRDGTLARKPGGRELIADYYNRAPKLVERINRRADAARIWLRTYWTGVLPCALAAAAGFDALALRWYMALTRRLERLARPPFLSQK